MLLLTVVVNADVLGMRGEICLLGKFDALWLLVSRTWRMSTVEICQETLALYDIYLFDSLYIKPAIHMMTYLISLGKGTSITFGCKTRILH